MSCRLVQFITNTCTKMLFWKSGELAGILKHQFLFHVGKSPEIQGLLGSSCVNMILPIE